MIRGITQAVSFLNEMRGKMSILKKLISLILVFLIVHILPIIARAIAGSFDFSGISNDPLRQLAFVSITYIVQISLILTTLKISFKGSLSNAGFNLDNKSLSLSILTKFICIWSMIVILFYILALNFYKGFGDYIINICPPDFWYILKQFIGSVVFAGIGEEPLFRSFVILALTGYWSGSFKFAKVTIPHISIISGFIFMTAHIGYTVYPVFTITYIDPLRLTFTFILGVVWTNIFIKTKSLLCPVLAHSSANAIQYTAGFIASFILTR